MPVSIAETIGMFRADLRRVELTLGSRIDARVAANEAWLRDEAQREREAMAAELCRFREEVARALADVREELRRRVEEAVNDLRMEIRSIGARVASDPTGGAESASDCLRSPP